jgi:hypothetical protein
MPETKIKTEPVDFNPFAAKAAGASETNVKTEAVDFNPFAAPPAQATLRFDAQGNQLDAQGKPIPAWDPHRNEQGYLPTLGRAAMALPGSAYRAGEQLVSTIANAGQVYDAVKKLGFKGVAQAIGNDLVEHYGSLEKARRTFETDPARFLLDIAALGTGGGGLLAKLPGVAGMIGEAAVTAGRAVDPVLAAGKAATALREPAARVLGRTTGAGAPVMRQAGQAGQQATALPAGARSMAPRGLSGVLANHPGVAAGLGAGFGPVASAHPYIAGALAAPTIPFVGGAAMYGLGAVPRVAGRVAPVARGASAAAPGREKAQTQQTYTIDVGGERYRFQGPPGMTEAQQRQAVEERAPEAARTKVTVHPEQGGYNAALR